MASILLQIPNPNKTVYSPTKTYEYYAQLVSGNQTNLWEVDYSHLQYSVILVSTNWVL